MVEISSRVFTLWGPSLLSTREVLPKFGIEASEKGTSIMAAPGGRKSEIPRMDMAASGGVWTLFVVVVFLTGPLFLGGDLFLFKGTAFGGTRGKPLIWLWYQF